MESAFYNPRTIKANNISVWVDDTMKTQGWGRESNPQEGIASHDKEQWHVAKIWFQQRETVSPQELIDLKQKR